GSQQLQRLTSGNRRESVISYNSVSTRPSIDLGSSYRNDRQESLRDFSPNNSNNFRSLTPPLESPPPEVEERRESKLWNHNIRLDELQLVQQELARKRLIEGNSVAPYSYTESSRPSTTPVLNTKAEVHVTPPATRMYTRPDSIESAPLGGAAAVLAERRLSHQANNLPGILGPPEEFGWISKVPSHVYQCFSLEELEGRPLKGLIYNRTLDLGVDIEGGIGSPLGGKILVAVVFEGGVAQMSGQIRAGDQLMMINGQSLVNVTSSQAERIINDATNTARDRVELYYCETTLVNDEDSVTYF
ncbi:PDZ domain-containing protein 7-like, partial [Physella acuta]|uniref:PDZ domain-containing protein 7-like n=1 Tax=Physella acuta TaxID=109671 RepID=UPI0027DD4991